MTADHLNILKRLRCAVNGAVLRSSGCLLDGQGILIILSGVLSNSIGIFTQKNLGRYISNSLALLHTELKSFLEEHFHFHLHFIML